MFLIFNKEYREFEKTMSILYSKAKKSEKMTVVYEKDEKNLECEVYKLDTMDIWFNYAIANRSILVVKDKTGKKITELDCHFDGHNGLQDAKSNQFSGLLQEIRKIYDKRVEAQKMKEATAKAKKEAEAKIKAENAEKTRIQMLADANNRLRDM